MVVSSPVRTQPRTPALFHLPSPAIHETYATFDASPKSADARAADEADLKALEQSIGNRHKR